MANGQKGPSDSAAAEQLLQELKTRAEDCHKRNDVFMMSLYTAVHITLLCRLCCYFQLLPKTLLQRLDHDTFRFDCSQYEQGQGFALVLM